MPDRSFQDYVTSRFEDEIFQAVEKFVSVNRLKPEFTTKKISYPSSTVLDRIWIKSVAVNDLPKMEIEFIVTVEAQIDLQVVRGQWDDFDECFPWIQLKCRGDLDQSLDDFEVTGIRTFDKSKPAPRPLDDALVPYLKKENYEEEVRTFLKRNHYSEMLLEPQAIDPLLLAQRMGLTVLRRTISQDYSIFGEIFFADCDTEFYDPEKEQMVPEHVQAKTIVVDPQAYFLRNLGSYNLTIVHECVHWDRHRKAFKLEQLYNRNAAQIKCEVVGGIRNTGAKCATDWMEQQANVLSPKIMMPLDSFKKKASSLIKHYRKQLETFELVDVMEPVIKELSVFYGVSVCAAKIRMVEAGYEEAIGVLTYIDGHYVRPHYFRKGSITLKQTYTVGIIDVAIERAVNSEFRSRLEQGNYVFVENHVCFNSEKYVERDIVGNLQLTEYGRLHIDECCLFFDIQVKSVNKYSEAFYTECALYRDADSKVTFEAHYASGNQSHEKQPAELAAFQEDVLGLIKSLPGSFAGAMDKVMDWSDMTEEEIAGGCELDVRTIQRIRNDDNQSPSVETIMQLCVAMRLPPQVSRILISKGGYTFKANNKDFIYGVLLDGCYLSGLEECNRILVSQGIKPLGGISRKALKEEDPELYKKLL